jgi:hypothetical protein
MTFDSGDVLDDATRQKLADAGWKQGAFLNLAEFKHLLKIPDEYDQLADTLVVATQTCDLLYHSFLTEPEVEVLLAQKAIGSVKSDVGKSFRTFGLEIDGDLQSHIQVLSRKIYSLDRRILFQIGRLLPTRPTTRSTAHFAGWLASRYNRPAYPDAFLAFTTKGKNADKIKTACEKLPSCTGLFLTLDNWDELPSGPYKVSVHLVMSANSTTIQLQEASVQHGRIEALFDVEGIEIDSSVGGVFSEKDLSLHDYRGLSKWQLDYLTIRDVSGQHVNPAPPFG